MPMPLKEAPFVTGPVINFIAEEEAFYSILINQLRRWKKEREGK